MRGEKEELEVFTYTMDVSEKLDAIKSKTNKYMLPVPVKYLSEIFLFFFWCLSVRSDVSH